MTNLVELIAKQLVDQPEKVKVTNISGNSDGVIRLEVAASDMGKVIGKQGRIAKAIRTVVKAAGTKDNTNYSVEIVSDEEIADMEAGLEYLARKREEAEAQNEEEKVVSESSNEE